MEKTNNVRYKGIEEKYWWFVARRNFISLLIQQLKLNSAAKILDVGCFSGSLLTILERNGFRNACGIDINKDAIDRCKKKGLKNIFFMDGLKTHFKNEEFDLIIASDVLEHIKDDKSALAEWNRILKPNGFLLLFVPAFDSLWSCNDEWNNHYRRYRKPHLIDKLLKSKFKIQRISFWNVTLFLPIFLSRKIEYHKSKKTKNIEELYKISPFLNNLFALILKLENATLKHFNAPIGVSIFAICKKLGTGPDQN